MVENHPSRRRVYGREHAAARIPYDRERRAQARRAAEAVFASKPPVTEKPVDHSPQRPHVLPTAPPPARSEVIQSTTSPTTPRREAIPAADVARIRTWVKYGMTVPQIAAIYGAKNTHASEAPNRATSSRNPGRHHLGTPRRLRRNSQVFGGEGDNALQIFMRHGAFLHRHRFVIVDGAGRRPHSVRHDRPTPPFGSARSPT
jgi:hypothetical protein